MRLPSLWRPLGPALSLLGRPIATFAAGGGEGAGPRAALSPSLRVIAHRCGAGLGPENTAAAARRALSAGARELEVDVRQTADGRWICLHDDGLNRLAGLNRRASAMTLAELRAVRIGGEPIPTLAELLAQARGAERVHVDVKGWTQELSRACSTLLEELGPAEGAEPRVSVCSLSGRFLAELRRRDRDVDLGVLFVWRSARASVARAIALGASSIGPLAVVPRFALLARQAHAAGLKVLPYTVDGARLAERLARDGADGVVTNHPDRLLAARA